MIAQAASTAPDVTSFLTGAALLGGLTYGLTVAAKNSLPFVKGKWANLAALLASTAATFLVAYSSWGETQVVGGLKLSDVNIPGLIVVILIGFILATITDHVIGPDNGALREIGQNKTGETEPPLDPNDFSIGIDTSGGELPDPPA